MKKLFFIAAIIIYGVTFGQESSKKNVIEKGTFNIGGKASLKFSNSENSDKTYKTDESGFEINPNFAYTIKNNLMIGLGVGYSHFKAENHTINNSIEEKNGGTSDGFNIFPYIKKYIPLGNKLLMYLQGELRYSENKSKTNYSNFLNNNDHLSKTFFVGFRPGISYFFSKSIAFESNFGAFGYSRLKSENLDNGQSSKYNSFKFSLDSSELLFGFSYFF